MIDHDHPHPALRLLGLAAALWLVVRVLVRDRRTPLARGLW